jgi:(2Fe-2S) ferredoxin
MKKFFNSEDLENYRKEVREKASRFSTLITVCQGGCKAFGSEEILERLSSEVRKRRLNKKVIVKMAGCHGFCERGPLVLIFPKGIFYGRVTVKDVPEIVEETIVKDRLVERLLVHSPQSKENLPLIDQIPFYKRQMRLVLKHNGRINPESLDDYLEVGGYSALAKALNRKSGDIINEVKISGLRGRGGAGFPTGLKWELTARAIGDTKYIICNADEGDPGAFMDRSVLEGNPHSVLEGMIIGGYAIGANEGYIYVRAEYPLAIERLKIAV